MENVQRTIYSSYNQACMSLNIPIDFTPLSTLNEKFNVALSKTVPANQYPKLGYVVIGNGGHKMQVDADGFYSPVPTQHTAVDAALFNHLPFVLREPTNDLTTTEIANYRLRIPVTYNNVQYIAYYAKVLDESQTTPALVSKTINSGVETIVPYSPSVNNLAPTPVDMTTTAPNLVNNNYVRSIALVKFTLTANDISEIINACKIIYGSSNKAIISEIGICSGYDVLNQSTIGASSTSYTEVARAQINTFNSTFYPLNFINNTLDVTFNVGSTEPLLDLTTL